MWKDLSTLCDRNRELQRFLLRSVLSCFHLQQGPPVLMRWVFRLIGGTIRI